MSQRAQFTEQGFAVFRGLVPPARIAALTAAFDDAFEVARKGGRASVELRGGEVWQLVNARTSHPAIAEWIHDPLLGGHAADLLDAKRIQLLQDAIILKPAKHGGRVEWHQDFSYTGYLDSPRALSVRLSLTSCTVDTGCLHVIPGSHRWGLQGENLALRAQHVADASQALPAALAARVSDAVPLELEPGDVSVHHCLTFHSSVKNRSPAARKTIVTHLFDGDCRLAPGRLPRGAEAGFPTDAEGRLAGEQFPVLYTRS